MEYLRQFFRAVGGKWITVPGAVAGLIGISSYMRAELGLTWAPEINRLGLIGLTLAPLIIWALAGLTHRAVVQGRKLADLEHAWDRSGRNLVSIQEAIEVVIKNLSDTWPSSIAIDEKRQRAARKLRELGQENQVPIWGFQIRELPSTFEEYRESIPPGFWRWNRIEVEYVFDTGASTPDQPVIHTIGQPRPGGGDRTLMHLDFAFPYGDLRINRFALEAACPPASISA